MNLLKMLIICFTFLLIVKFSIASDNEYLNEFNNPNENCTIFYSWAFIDNSTKVRKIVDYRCCDKECINLPYDTKNNEIVIDTNLQDIAKFIVFKSDVDEGVFKETDYEVSTYEKSVTCNYYGIDVLKEQSRNLGVKVTIDDVSPKVLSKNAQKTVRNIYEIAKDLQIIKEVNPTALIISASCVGSNLIEYYALSSLKTCKSYITNSKNQFAYFGMVDDYINCNQDSLERLNIAKYSPDILLQHVEKRAIESFQCYLKTTKMCNDYSETKYDFYIKKINELEGVTSKVNFNNEVNLIVEKVNKRFDEKKNEVNNKINQISENIKIIEQKIQSKENDITNILYTPNYDFSNIKTNLDILNVEMGNAKGLFAINKFNSAMTKLNENGKLVVQINNILNAELSKDRKIKNIVWIVLVLIIIFLIYWYKKRNDYYY